MSLWGLGTGPRLRDLGRQLRARDARRLVQRRGEMPVLLLRSFDDERMRDRSRSRGPVPSPQSDIAPPIAIANRPRATRTTGDGVTRASSVTPATRRMGQSTPLAIKPPPRKPTTMSPVPAAEAA